MSTSSDAILLAELRHVIPALSRLKGMAVRQAWVPTPESVILSVGRRTLLRIETYPIPRIHSIESRPTQPKTPYSFQGLLRARMTGPIRCLRLAESDRVLDIIFDQGTLHIRFFGRGGGIWWLEEDRVVACSSGPAPDALPPLTAREDADRPPRFAPADGCWDLGARQWFETLARKREVERWRRHLSTWTRRKSKKARQLMRNLEADLERAEGAETLRETADCLAACLHLVRRGANSIEVPDLFSAGATREVELDPTRPPSETLRRMYDKARRFQAAEVRIMDRLVAVEAQVIRHDDTMKRLQTADLSELRSLQRKMKAPAPGTPRRPTAATRSPFRQWEGPDQQHVLVGRSAKSNHKLTFSVARGRDWWFHRRDEAGPHVILRARKGENIPLETLLALAQIVLIESRVAVGEAIDVQYTRVANLRPISPANPGRTAVTSERVLHVRRDDGALVGWSRVS